MSFLRRTLNRLDHIDYDEMFSIILDVLYIGFFIGLMLVLFQAVYDSY